MPLHSKACTSFMLRSAHSFACVCARASVCGANGGAPASVNDTAGGPGRVMQLQRLREWQSPGPQYAALLRVPALLVRSNCISPSIVH